MEAKSKFTVTRPRGESIPIEEFAIRGRQVYKVALPNKDSFFITKAKDASSYDFWTSIPEGKLELAMEIGALLDDLRNKPKQTPPPTLF